MDKELRTGAILFWGLMALSALVLIYLNLQGSC